jgi:hypothetical protein
MLTTVQLANGVLLIGSDGGSYLNSMAVWQVKCSLQAPAISQPGATAPCPDLPK